MLILGLMAVIFIAWFVVVMRYLSAIFSPEARKKIGEHKILHALWLVVSSTLVFLILFGEPRGNIRMARRAMTENSANQVQIAILNYETEYGSSPSGKTNAELVRELEGDNPRKIEFLSLRPSDKNIKGEMLDAWGRPLVITMTDPHHPIVESAGPDRKWGTKDDLKAVADPDIAGGR
jgi:hypothetical protein